MVVLLEGRKIKDAFSGMTPEASLITFKE
jgi:hypothetical protein